MQTTVTIFSAIIRSKTDSATIWPLVGYIWIGTRDGLNRFDGYTFKVFRNDPDETETLGSNWITCLGCDMNGDLWVGTLSGLYQYDDEKESFRHIPFTADKGIDIFQFDKDNKLWILTVT